MFSHQKTIDPHPFKVKWIVPKMRDVDGNNECEHIFQVFLTQDVLNQTII